METSNNQQPGKTLDWYVRKKNGELALVLEIAEDIQQILHPILSTRDIQTNDDVKNHNFINKCDNNKLEKGTHSYYMTCEKVI
mgnify:CR=1 FL=1